MFTSQSPATAVPPGALVVLEQRLDDVVRRLDVRGTLDAATLGELGRRVDAALSGGVRWLVVDMAAAATVSDEALDALVAAARELRSRKGELIVAGAPRGAAERLAALDIAHRPAQAASADELVMTLKLLRPDAGSAGPAPRAKQRVASLMLPRIEPPG